MAKDVNCDINGRVKSICDIIYDGNVTQMAKSTYIRRTTLMSIIGDSQTTPGYDVLRKLMETHAADINPDWLLTGRGEMLAGDSKTAAPVQRRPHIPAEVYAGLTTGFADSVALKDCEMRPLITAFPDYDYTITIKGDSMQPMLMSGDVVAIRKACDYIEWGKTYVVSTREGAIVKRLYPPKDDSQAFECVSLNPDYPPFALDKSQVLAIYRLVASFRVY